MPARARWRRAPGARGGQKWGRGSPGGAVASASLLRSRPHRVGALPPPWRLGALRPSGGGRCLLRDGGGRCGPGGGAARAGAASGAADGESGRGRRRRLLVGPGTAGRGLCVRRRRRWCSGPAEPAMWLYMAFLMGLYYLLRWYQERQVVSRLQDKFVFITGCDSGTGTSWPGSSTYEA
uniref:Uncharacterized protein n=1 Tax=Bos mutus grunniens TaxID=30521 RepID=A0A8B9WJ73_BOSMU